MINTTTITHRLQTTTTKRANKATPRAKQKNTTDNTHTQRQTQLHRQRQIHTYATTTTTHTIPQHKDNNNHTQKQLQCQIQWQHTHYTTQQQPYTPTGEHTRNTANTTTMSQVMTANHEYKYNSRCTQLQHPPPPTTYRATEHTTP